MVIFVPLFIRTRSSDGDRDSGFLVSAAGSLRMETPLLKDNLNILSSGNLVLYLVFLSFSVPSLIYGLVGFLFVSWHLLPSAGIFSKVSLLQPFFWTAAFISQLLLFYYQTIHILDL